jgi:hypothetical protein
VRDALIGFHGRERTGTGRSDESSSAGPNRARQGQQRTRLGRKPSYTREQFDAVRTMLGNQAAGITRVAKDTGPTRQTVYRIKDDPGRRGGGFGCMGPEAFGPDNADTGNSGVDPDPQGTLAESPSRAGRCIPPEYRRSRQPVPTLQALGRPGPDLREAEDNISLHVKPAALDRTGATLITSSNVTTLRGKGHRPTC